MKFRLILSVFTLVNVLSASAGTYINSGTVQSPPDPAPQIDADTFINQSYFEVNDFSITPLPYQTTRTLNFRNDALGVMLGHPGYFFEYVSGNIREPMTSWRNFGSISSFSGVSNIFIFTTAANWLLVNSDLIVNSGSLNASAQGLIRLDGNTLRLTRGRLRAGSPIQSFASGSGGFYLYDTNYFNDPGLTDLYWGAGNNNVVSGTGTLMPLDSGLPSFTVTNLRSAIHEIVQPFGGGRFFTNSTIIPFSTFFKGILTSAYVSTNLGANQIFVQAVFVPTNLFDTNLATDIKFFPDPFRPDGPATVQVGFHSVERDVALDLDITNSVYVLDGMVFRTNAVLGRNRGFGINTRRPDTYEVTRAPFRRFSLGGGVAEGRSGNASFTDFPLYRSSYVSNTVPMAYAAYSAQVAAQSLGGSDPTNLPGRVEIIGQTVNLTDARVRAESTFILKAGDLVANNLARASAPFMSFDVGTTQPELVVSNLAPLSVSRLSGTVSAWTALWDNMDTNIPNMNIRFHVLIVDQNLQGVQPVTVSQFFGQGARVILHDFLSVNQRLRIDAGNLHVKPLGGLSFPPNWSWGASNMQNIINFTNEGFVTVPGLAALGTDRSVQYSNVINQGSFSAQLLSIGTDCFENYGSMASQGGFFRVGARKIAMRGQPITREVRVFTNIVIFPVPTTNYFTNIVFTGAASLTARGDMTLNANNITFSNTLLQTGNGVPGALIINATNRLTDSGPPHTNYWTTTGGIQVRRLPSMASDLMGTYVTIKALPFAPVQNVWDGKNLGPSVVGYTNNLALGKLTLDGGEESQIRFSGMPGKDNAIYVDYLELLNNATNFNDPAALTLDSNIKIYFAHSNIEAKKLEGAQGNRIRWVSGFMGPLSTTNIVYPSGEVHPANISLVRHNDIDSDCDGQPNVKDSTPLYTAENIALAISRQGQPNRVLLSWRAVPGSLWHLDYKPAINPNAQWQVLASDVATNCVTSLIDTTTGRTQRIYRVRVDLPPQ